MNRSSVDRAARAWPDILLFALLAGSICIAGAQAHAADEPPATVALGTFESGIDYWDFSNGPEFKGAKGSLSRATGGHTGQGAARLAGDFAKGGSYVAMKRPFSARPREVRFWVKAEGITGVTVRLTDATKQTFQYELPLMPGNGWQLVTLNMATAKAKGHFGGAADGRWFGSAHEIWIMLSRKDGGKEPAGACLIDDVEVVAEPWGKPHPMPEGVQVSSDSIFGFSSHMIHSDLFLRQMGPYWRLDHILPLVVEGRFGVMREPLYQGLFADDRKNPPVTDEDKAKEAARVVPRQGRREMVEDYLGRYQDAGVRVTLCPMFTPSDRPGFAEYFHWIGELAKRFPIQAVEMHNEPNLKFFWGGTPHQYAEACKDGARIIKEHSPRTPVVIGSISHLWWKPGIDFLQSVLKEGALDSADGVSVHPYRQKSAPEGGAMKEPADSPVGFERELREFWAMVQGYNRGNRPLGLYLTEYGYSSGTKGGLVPGQSEGTTNVERQADYLSRSMLLLFDVRLRGLPIEGIYWYDLKCDGESPEGLEANFGLVSYETSELRPGYKAYARIAGAFGKTHDWEAADLPVASTIQEKAVKSFAWRRPSDGALILSFWRLNQLQARDEDFKARLAWPLPAGFEPGRVLLHDLHRAEPVEVAATTSDGRIAADLNVTARAAWLEVFPARATALHWAGQWSHVLPAEFAAPGGARIRLNAPRRIAVGSAADLTVTIDNREGKQPFAGALHWMGRETVLTAEAGREVTVRLPGLVAADKQPQVGWYLVLAGETIIGRGGYTVLVEAPSPSGAARAP